MPDFTLAEQIIHNAAYAGVHIATAESCTGGLIAASLSDVSGASVVFRGGVVAYTEDIKHRVLKLPISIFDNNGVYSDECARALALGAQKLFHVEFSLATTGIAGPTGALPHKPIGSVWVGVATPQGIRSFYEHFSGSRKDIRTSATRWALSLLFDALLDI